MYARLRYPRRLFPPGFYHSQFSLWNQSLSVVEFQILFKKGKESLSK